MTDLSLHVLRKENEARLMLWHGITTWSVMEWGCAMAGEAGEACNVAKKIRRVEQGIWKREGEDKHDFKTDLAEECADTLIYLDLLCASQGIDLAEAVRDKFNRTSREFNFPQRI